MRRDHLQPRSENGSVMIMAILILLAVLAMSAGTFEATQLLGDRTNRDTNAQQAFQAADSGVDMAVHRLALLNPAATDCISTVAYTPSGTSWCTLSTAETVGSGASYTYSVSTSPSTGCVGTMPAGSVTDRCIVATGTANGVRRRLMVRVVGQGGQNTRLFARGNAIGLDSVKLESNVTVTSDLHTNGKLEVAAGSTISGPVTIGPKAKTPKGICATCWSREPSDFTASLPDFMGTANPYDAVSNPTGNNNASISGSYYSDTVASPRTLRVPKNKAVSLAPGRYNFCTIQIDGRGILNAAGYVDSVGVVHPVEIYLDSPFRPGSGCKKNQGQIKAGGSSAIVNPSLDPRALVIYAWGSTSRKKATRLQIPMGKKSTLAALIIAPASEVRFGDNKGLLLGGIIGRRIVFKKQMTFRAGTALDQWTTTTLSQSFRVAWKECNSRTVNPSPPSQGC